MVSIIHFCKNFRDIVIYPDKLGMPFYGFTPINMLDLLDFYTYDFYLGPGVMSFNNGYPFGYLQIKLAIWFLMIVMIFIYFISKKEIYFNILITISILPFIFFILSFWHMIEISSEISDQDFPYIILYQVVNIIIFLFSDFYLIGNNIRKCFNWLST